MWISRSQSLGTCTLIKLQIFAWEKAGGWSPMKQQSPGVLPGFRQTCYYDTATLLLSARLLLPLIIRALSTGDCQWHSPIATGFTCRDSVISKANAAVGSPAISGQTCSFSLRTIVRSSSIGPGGLIPTIRSQHALY